MIIIGEKINGSIPSVKKAIEEKDGEKIKHLAKIQADAGAAYIDCCASVEEGIEVETLKWMIELIQEATDVPVCVDSPSANVCAEALKFCNKPGLVNSVSMEGDKIDAVFPVIADTEWSCVALLCDDSGIPDKKKRIDVFEALMKRVEEFKIDPSRIFIDPLVVTCSTDTTALTAFAEVTRTIKEMYPAIHITSGLSNISFGLPARKYLNQAFLVMAMTAGMDSAILDPTNNDSLGLLYATEVLLEKDDFCLEYISAYREELFGTKK
ncbi:methyltetrahydrofolate cobalamin methyltransferase [Thermodesulfobacteriota bacterium]